MILLLLMVCFFFVTTLTQLFDIIKSSKEDMMKKILLFIITLTVTFTLIGCDARFENPTSQTTLSQVKDLEEFKTLVESTNYNRMYYDDVAVPETAMDGNVSEDATTEKDASETNVQVAGVDEGDIIKTDGNRIYRVNYNSLIAVEVNGAEMSIVLDETLESSNDNSAYTYYLDLYLTDRYLVVIGQRYDYVLYTPEGGVIDGDDDIITDALYWYYPGIPQTIIELYDINTLEKADIIEISGNYMTTRLIDDMLYVISNHDIYLYDDTIDPRPVLLLNDTVEVPEYNDIFYIEDSTLQTFTIITSVSLLDSVEATMDVYLGTAYWGNIFVSREGIYLATNTYYYDEANETWYNQGLVMSYLFSEDGSIVFGGKAEYQGYVLNQYAMDRYGEYFRMVTTDGWGESVKNRLYIFEHTTDENGYAVMSLVSLLDEGIGKPNERVQSARFNGDMVTVVTFEQTDPLYIIDLSDPLNPIITSEIEVTGFGTYQHPWSDGTLLVIGYETNAEGSIIGIKVTLFDTSDKNNIAQIGEPVVFLNQQFGWSYSEALWNPKSILISEERGLFGFSMSRYTYTDFDYFYMNDYIIFHVDPTNLDTPITVEKVITHSDIYINDILQDETSMYRNYYYYYNIERAVYIDQTLYVISNGAITAHDMTNNYERLSEITYDPYK